MNRKNEEREKQKEENNNDNNKPCLYHMLVSHSERSLYAL